jgi:hypothetical protein
LGPDIGLVKPPGESFAPIQVSWESGKLAFLGEFVASRGSDVNWFTYSLQRVEPGVLTDPNFESPFDFYDLAADHDSYPEMAIRMERFNVDDRYSPAAAGWRGRPYQQIRYSWDQDNTQNWSYTLGLLGSHTVDQVVTFPEFSLTTVPYNDFPKWVIDQNWNVATFVATEGPYWTTEGGYDADPGRSIRDGYYAGQTNDISDFGTQVTEGRRIDTVLDLDAQAWLYFSPVDRKLHLLRADSGVWNIDGRRQLYYLNSGGETFDGWRLVNSGRLEAQLYQIPGGLIYSDEGGTFLLNADVSNELFRTLPPTTHEEWQQLGAQIDDNKRDIDPGDLRAMFDQFGGDPVQISTGQIEDFTRTSNGISFVARIDDEGTRETVSSLAGASASLGLQEFTFVDNLWHVAPTVSASPTISISVDTSSRALTTIPISVQIDNPGSFGLDNAELLVQVVAPDGQARPFNPAPAVTIPAYGDQTFSFPWAPTQGGTWTITATLTRKTGDVRTGQHVIIQQQTEAVPLPAPEVLQPETAGLLGSDDALIERVALMLGVVLLSGMVAMASLWKGLRLK